MDAKVRNQSSECRGQPTGLISAANPTSMAGQDKAPTKKALNALHLHLGLVCVSRMHALQPLETLNYCHFAY